MSLSAETRSLHWPSFITVLSAAILIGTELLGAAWACGWALAGFFELGATVARILQGIFGLLAIAAIGVFLRQAFRIEAPFKARS